ncbi:cupin [Leptolyngbya sp. BL0902]|uniref:cysteine dioxygenase family protein n=1 Tax=Leptolyngbya sp. BL0902 TaxID=1115757 RepID=UPI0018E6E8E4|nr:cupin [Leptolyngbya sp. BL0902]QQE65479.1 cupin [Leptolyngbya sp. BL0902]
MHHNWLVTDDGQYRPFGHPHSLEPGQYYRLYRFLTDVEDILATFHDDISRIEAITPLVRKLLSSSYWLKTTALTPDPEKGWASRDLYQEHEFPLTLQMVTWLPGPEIAPKTYDTWGILALVSGQMRHELGGPSLGVDPPQPEPFTQDLILNPGDVIAFTHHTRHRRITLGETPTVALALYGAPHLRP